MAVSTITAMIAIVRMLVWYPIKVGVSIEAWLQEALLLASWAVPDEEKFVARNFNWDLVTEMALRVQVAREADAECKNIRFARIGAAIKRFDTEAPAAWACGKSAIKELRVALSGNAGLMKRLSIINKGRSKSQKVQNLFELVSLCELNPELLAAINFGPERLAELRGHAEKMGILLAECSAECLSESEHIIFRDKSLIHVDEAVVKIREMGKTVNEFGSSRYKGYESAERRKKNHQQRNTDSEKKKIIEARIAVLEAKARLLDEKPIIPEDDGKTLLPGI